MHIISSSKTPKIKIADHFVVLQVFKKFRLIFFSDITLTCRYLCLHSILLHQILTITKRYRLLQGKCHRQSIKDQTISMFRGVPFLKIPRGNQKRKLKDRQYNVQTVVKKIVTFPIVLQHLEVKPIFSLKNRKNKTVVQGKNSS